LKEIDAFNERVVALHHALGIGSDYLETSKLPLCREPSELVDTELDFYQRPQNSTPDAFQAWCRMKLVAEDTGVALLLISAFRDIDYQHDLIARKVREGRTIEEVLTVNAAPGFSEHHILRPLVKVELRINQFAWFSAKREFASF
jgi:D-alanyl-D-alanine carboxypeptidase